METIGNISFGGSSGFGGDFLFVEITAGTANDAETTGGGTGFIPGGGPAIHADTAGGGAGTKGFGFVSTTSATGAGAFL